MILARIKDTRNCSDKLFNLIENGSTFDIQEFLENLPDEQKISKISYRKWSGYGVLHKAASLGKTDLCKLFIEHGIKIDEISTRGWYTPLHVAIGNGHMKTAQFLIESGASTVKKSKYNEDPYEYGMSRGFKSATKELRARTQQGFNRFSRSDV
eukprot:gene23583-30581_t